MLKPAGGWTLVAALGVTGAITGACTAASPSPSASTTATATAPVTGPQPIRLAGTVEASRARAVLVPRMAGQTTPTLVLTALAKAGSQVQAGEVIAEFDPQDQIRSALERQAEMVDLDGQIAKKKS